MKHCYLAIDLGATSGRAVLGSVTEDTFVMEEIARFPNRILPVGGHLYWNIYVLYDEILKALKEVARRGVELTSIGIDTWGVDFAFVGRDGSLLGLPHSYRDPHTQGASREFFREVMPQEELYAQTGLQVMDINTLFQLYTLKKNGSSALAAAHKILFMPDALGYMLTGKAATEYTIASTSHFLDPFNKTLNKSLLGRIGIDPELFAPVVMPGTVLGPLLPSVCAETGLPPVPVVSVAGHDTASGVAAVPTPDEAYAYLSSGTWSLMGILSPRPIVSAKAARYELTNEGGLDGSIRFLRNITGMWLLEQSLKAWEVQGIRYTYDQVKALALEEEPFRCFINPDDPGFAHPQDMPAAIAAYVEARGGRVPKTHAQILRCIFDSLALRYRQVLDNLRELSPFAITRLHIIGGGSKNELLNMLTANALQIPVVAGPAEATAMGNILIQASAATGQSMQELKASLSSAFPTQTFVPRDGALWEEAYRSYLAQI